MSTASAYSLFRIDVYASGQLVGEDTVSGADLGAAIDYFENQGYEVQVYELG